MADRPSINEEAGLPSNFIPVDVPAITGRPSPPSVGDITPVIPQYFQGSLNPDLQHDADFVNTALRSSSAPKFALMPPGIQSSPLTSTQITSAIKTNSPPPSTGGGGSGITSLTLTAPVEINVAGSPTSGTTPEIDLSWATQPAGFEFAVPNGTVGFDGVNFVSQNGASSISVTSPAPSTSPEWALYLAACSGTGSFPAGPSGWSALPQSILANEPIYTKAVPAGGTVTATQTISTPTFVAEVAAILLFSGIAINVVQSNIGTDVGTGTVTVTLPNPTAAGNFVLAIATLGAPSSGVVPNTFTDSQRLSQTQLLYVTNTGVSGRPSIGLQVVLLSTCTTASESVTITYPIAQQGQLVVYEISALSPIAVKPRFMPEALTDLSQVTGTLPVLNGGTGANLSGTGGTSRVLRQSSLGAAITVSQLAASDLSNGTTGTGAVVLVASPTMTGVVKGGTFDSTDSPAGLAGFAVDGYDSTTKTPVYNSNNNGVSAFTGAWNNVNVTPVTVSANTTGDQNLMSVSIPAGTLNRVGRSFKIHCAGVYTTPALSSATVEIKVKLGTLTLLDIVSSANPGSVTNNKWLFDGWITTQTGGASAAFEASGAMIIDLGSLTTSPDTIFADTNAATIGTLDSTAAQTLQVTVAFNSASASNSATQRQMIIETVN